MISGTVLLEIPGSRAIQRYDRPSATARMTDSSQQRYGRFHRFQRKYRMRLEPDSRANCFTLSFQTVGILHISAIISL